MTTRLATRHTARRWITTRVEQEKTDYRPFIDPERVYNPRKERRLVRRGVSPVGSRRRRAAISTTSNVPFHLLPYQCFQEARAVLQEDRQEKLATIERFREKIEKLRNKQVPAQEEDVKQKRLADMRRKLEETKILADINDPLVKKKFEDGMGDMSKPIYRHLADKKWRSYKRLLLVQRITQMHVVPDILPAIDPIVSTSLGWPAQKKWTKHGDFVDSLVSERPPAMKIQPYDQGKRLYTIAVVNPDVPNVKADGYTHRCHFLASNIEVSPTDTEVDFNKLAESQVILPWMPAYSQKGLKYQRMAIFILEQTKYPLDVAAAKQMSRYSTRDGFTLRSLLDKFDLKPVGVDLFRTRWDENTADVMKRANITGWDVEFKQKITQPLPYQRKSTERYR
ncbi:putative mitochondrial large ribosomal subunit YmL35 [Piedraia hortae CBS 480.64]|uniref:Large ribosomal subunit protein mL38 n=1 Tax=Piedraia hortae CBS 480.64 TaxID=1314780 RepID=A0A6A7BY35_9PEZI|nr:putative mitochondrial large ribosomal subunit YmL35 [Piedraia hortae CBS 480.64]